ncbi:hypothetical protein, partial [Candidatus Protofrankia datiscae]|uniref:hypothetical protein n=2 Tax=Protofrankia TaxID=2994361 RepID=UPI0019CFE583
MISYLTNHTDADGRREPPRRYHHAGQPPRRHIPARTTGPWRKAPTPTQQAHPAMARMSHGVPLTSTQPSTLERAARADRQPTRQLQPDGGARWGGSR